MKVDGTIVRDEDQVNKLVMDHLRRIQIDERYPMYHSPLPFPNLPVMMEEEMKSVFRRLWPGKAIAMDCIGDNIFGVECYETAMKVLRDLWSRVKIKNFHFKMRLVPLNKKYPDVPVPDQVRPVVVCGPLMRILGTRLRGKLQDYLKYHLHRSQVAVTEGMDIYVDIWRASHRINELRSRNKVVYCFFLDFIYYYYYSGYLLEKSPRHNIFISMYEHYM